MPSLRLFIFVFLTMKKIFSNRRLIRAIIAITIALPSYGFLLLIRNRSLEGVHFYAYAQYVLAVFLGLFLLFEIHQLKSAFLERVISWKTQFRKRFWLELGISLLLVPPLVTGTYAGLYILVWKMPLYGPSIILYNALGFFISLLFMGFVNADYILGNWKASLLKAEQLEKEQVKARLSELQNQLSPHFLFNHFNILYSLIDEDPERAKEFLNRLSEIYRYILGKKKQDLVELSEELIFLNHYIFLMKTRFEDKIRVKMEMEQVAGHFLIPPLSLQILLENAIRHNEASSAKPLEIRIRHHENYLVITNNFQPKSGNTQGTQTGLENIRSRLALFTNRPLLIEQDESVFKAQIPLIVLDSSS